MNQLMLQPGRAPGRATPGDQPAAPAQKTEASEAAPEGAPVGAPPGGLFGNMGTMMLLVPLLLFGLITMMNRKDKKKKEALEANLKKGDRVVTRAGFIGKVTEMGEKIAKVEIAPGVIVKIVKSSIEGLADETATGTAVAKPKSSEKSEKDDKKK